MKPKTLKVTLLRPMPDMLRSFQLLLIDSEANIEVEEVFTDSADPSRIIALTGLSSSELNLASKLLRSTHNLYNQGFRINLIGGTVLPDGMTEQ